MAIFPIKAFLGLRLTSNPEPGTARVASNFKRNRVRNQLEVSDGIATKYTFSPTTFGITSLVPKAVASFYVPDAGGQAVTAMVATYSKSPVGFSGSSVNSSGIFIRPYYDGSSWVDAWRELTEFQIFRYASKTGSVITVENSPALPSWGTDYLKGWTIIKSGDQTITEDTGLLVTASSGASITVAASDLSQITSWVGATTLLYAHRGLNGKVLPNTLAVNIRNLLDELRVSTGPNATDTDVALFYRDKTFFRNNNFIRKGTFGELGNFVAHPVTFGHATITADGSDPANGLPTGTYNVKTTLMSDDGQETELRSALDSSFSGAIAFLNKTEGASAQRLITVIDGYAFVLSDWTGSKWLTIKKIGLLNKDVVATVTDAVVGFSSACSDGSFIYVAKSSAAGTYGVYTYDTGLAQVTVYTGVTGDSSYVPTNFSAVSGGYIGVPVLSGTTYKMTLFSKAGVFVTSNTMQSTNAINDMVGDGSVGAYLWVSRNDSSTFRIEKFAGTALTRTDINMGVVPGKMTYYSANVYVASAAKIQKLSTADTFANWVTGGKITAMATSVTNNGTYLYITIPATYLVAYSGLAGASGTEEASLADTGSPADLFCATGTGAPGNGQSIIAIVANDVAEYTHLASGTTFVSGGQYKLKLKVYVSPGLLSIRAKYIRLYISKDGGAYYLVNTYDLLQDTETPYLDFDVATVWMAGKKHFYYRSQFITLDKAAYENATVEASAQLGRDIADTGASQYSYAITTNNRTYLVGRIISGKVQRNRVYLSTASGDGAPMYDIFPNDVTTVVEVEQNDGDIALALGPVGDRVLVLKNRSLLLLTPTDNGGHNKDVVAKGIGIAAVNSLVAHNESLYWLDHSGVWKFTTSGLEFMSEAIQDELLSYTVGQRAAAVAGIDPKNQQYRLVINQTIYVLDLIDGEWTTEAYPAAHVPAWFAIDTGSTDRRYIFLGNGLVEYPTERDTHNGNSIAFAWETNKIEIPVGMGFDAKVSALACDYDSDQNLTLSLYLDDATSPVKTYTLPSGNVGVVLAAPLASRCKSFRVRVSGSYTTAAEVIRVRRLVAYYNVIPVGGDRHRI